MLGPELSPLVVQMWDEVVLVGGPERVLQVVKAVNAHRTVGARVEMVVVKAQLDLKDKMAHRGVAVRPGLAAAQVENSTGGNGKARVERPVKTGRLVRAVAAEAVVAGAKSLAFGPATLGAVLAAAAAVAAVVVLEAWEEVTEVRL